MSELKIRPLHDHVIVRRITTSTETSGGILLPDAVDDKEPEGIVVAVGKGKRLDNGEYDTLEVKVDDKIIFGQKSGFEVGDKGFELTVLIEEEIIAILR